MDNNLQLNSDVPSGASYNPAPRRVSADSFRRLTSLLKKAEVPAFSIPEIIAPPSVQPILVEFMPVAESIAAPVIEAIDAPLEEPPQAEYIVPQQLNQFLAEPEIHLSEVPIPTQLIQEEPVVAPVAQIEPPLRSVLRRQNKRDEFAEVLNVPKATAAQLSPEQEIEQTALARSLIDMMSGGGGQPHERALAADTLLRMLPRLAQGIRAVLAQRLAMMETPPPFLVQRLLTDSDVTVSGPLLEDCMQIADESLFPVIAMGKPDQLRMIARRRRLSRAVTEALVRVADPSVLLTLVRNAAAEIPQEGFAELAIAASKHSELLPPLCIRQDLPIHTAFELFWPAPVQLRRYLLTRFLTDSETLTRILRITMQGEEQNTTAISVQDVGAGLEKALAGEREEAETIVAQSLKVSPLLIERIFGDLQGEALMALLKVAGVSRADLADNFVRLAAGDYPLIAATRNPEELQAVFDQLSFTKARILLTYWDWAATQSGPYAKLH